MNYHKQKKGFSTNIDSIFPRGFCRCCPKMSIKVKVGFQEVKRGKGWLALVESLIYYIERYYWMTLQYGCLFLSVFLACFVC